MDASQITKLRQKQQTNIMNRAHCVDSSTLTWANQIHSSTYLSQQRPPQQCNQREYGGQGKQTTLMTGSTQQFPSVFAGASGSAGRIFSSDSILLQKAGLQACGTTTPGTITLPIATEIKGTNTDSQKGPVNPYLPAFDTHYALKHPCFPSIDQHQKHKVTPPFIKRQQ
jgi:hypothetical protein